MSWWQEGLRGLFAIPTGGMSEMVGRNNQLGRTVTGGLEGGAGGFLTGGPLGAAMGAGTGMGLSGTGTTDPYSLRGGLINGGSGLGAGALGGGIAGSMSGGAMGGPTGSLFAPHAASAAAQASPTQTALQMMRGMGGGGQQQAQAPQQSNLERIYALYPQLRPSFGGPRA